MDAKIGWADRSETGAAGARCPKRFGRSCFFAGANSIIFYGERLLPTGNPEAEADRALFAKLGIEAG